jgi:hypothetical protein
MPEAYYPAVRLAIDIANETEYDGGANDRERYQRRMIERVLTQYEDLGGDNIEYLLTKLRGLGEDGGVLRDMDAGIAGAA